MGIVAGIFLVAGAVFTLIGGIGVVRFEDTLSRMHAAAKPTTLGVMLAAIGAAIEIRTAGAIAALVLLVVLQLLTTPVGSHVMGRTVYRQRGRVIDDR